MNVAESPIIVLGGRPKEKFLLVVFIHENVSDVCKAYDEGGDGKSQQTVGDDCQPFRHVGLLLTLDDSMLLA